MEISNDPSAFQNYQIVSDVIAERTKHAMEISELIKNEIKLNGIIFLFMES